MHLIQAKNPFVFYVFFFFLDRKKINLIYIFPKPDLFNQSAVQHENIF